MTEQKIRLTFAQPIKQVGENMIEVSVPILNTAMFTEELVSSVHSTMGKNRGEMLLDEVANDLLRKQILDGVR